MLYQKINIIARHVESHFFISLYQPSFSVDYFDFDTKIEAFLFIHPFLGINYKQSTYIPTLLKAHLIEALQSKTSIKIKSVKRYIYIYIYISIKIVGDVHDENEESVLPD